MRSTARSTLTFHAVGFALILLAAIGCTTTVTVTTPVAAADSYAAAGNCTLTVTASVLDNDSGGGTMTVSTYDATSTNGGTVTMASDGTFTYTPLAGDRTTTDTFTYTASNSAGTGVGTVTITISTMVWFIDNSGANGDGSQSSPFNSISNFNSTANDAADDVIVLKSGGGDYTSAGITLLSGQTLTSDEADVTVSSTVVASASGTRAVMAPGSDAITLNSGNTITGIDVGNTGTGAALTSNGDVGALTVSNMAISGTGNAVDIDSGTDTGASITIDSFTSTDATAAIALSNYAGAFTITGATSITDTSATTDAIAITTVSGTISISAASTVTIDDCQQQSIQISANTGTITFGTVSIDALPGGTAGDDTAIQLSSAGDTTFGDITFVNSDSAGLTVISHASGTLTVGNVTFTNAPGGGFSLANVSGGTLTVGDVTLPGTTNNSGNETGLDLTQTGGSITFGDFTMSAAASSRGMDITQSGGTLTFGDATLYGGTSYAAIIQGNGQDITFNSFTTVTGDKALVMSGYGTVDFGNVVAHDAFEISGGSGSGDFDITVNKLTVVSGDAALVLASGDGSDHFTLTDPTSSLEVNNGGQALRIDDWRVDDGNGNGFVIASLIGDKGTYSIEVFSLQDDFTITGTTTALSTGGSSIAGVLFDTVAAGVTVTFGGATTIGNAGSPVKKGIIVQNCDPTATFSFNSLSVYTNGSGTAGTGVDIADVIVEFTGSAPTVTSDGSDCAMRLTNCTSPNAGADTWTIGAINQDVNTVSGGAALELSGCTAVVAITGNINASNYTSDDQTALLISNHTGNVTVTGNITAQDFNDSSRGVMLTGITGDVTFDGTITVNNIPGTSHGVIITGYTSGAVTFNGAVSISLLGSVGAVVGTDAQGLLVKDSTVDVAINSTFDIGGVNGTGAIGIYVTNAGGGSGGTFSSGSSGAISITFIEEIAFWFEDWSGNGNTAVDLAGSLTINNHGNEAIRIDGDGSTAETMNVGDATIDCTTSGAGVYVNELDNSTLTFGNLDINCPSTDGFIAVNLRGDSDRSNSGMSFAINADDGTSGISYPANSGNGTAIYADGIASVSINGAANMLYQFSEIGTGSNDGVESAVGINAGPHAIYATDCTSVVVTYCRFANIGETGTDGDEYPIGIENTTAGFTLTTLTVTDCEFSENADGHAIYLNLGNDGSNPTITISDNAFQAVAGQDGVCYAIFFEVDGSVGDVSLQTTIAGNTFASFDGGGISVALSNGVGATTTATLQIGDAAGNVAGLNTFADIAGTGINIQCISGSVLRSEVNRATFTDNAGAIDSSIAVRVEHSTGDAGSSLDFNGTQIGIDGYNNAVPVQVFSSGAATDSEFRFAWSTSNTFANCSTGNAGISFTVGNFAYNSGAETGVCDVTISGTDFTSTDGIRQTFSSANDSLFRTYIHDNTNLSLIFLDRDSGGGNPDRLVVANVENNPNDPASDANIQDCLQDTDSNGNKNTDGAGFPAVTITAGDSAAVIYQSGATPVAAPTEP